MEEVCSLTNDKKETVRRKCKSGQYKAVSEKNGKFKLYKIALSSLDADTQGIYLARYGNSAWYKKYASYIPRDYTNLLAGSYWVSDHAQIDVAVNFNGSVCFPWVTMFRDIKTSKWLAWFLHADSPNSDHIFQAFYYGVQKFGLPNDIYLDNGKDYAKTLHEGVSRV